MKPWKMLIATLLAGVDVDSYNLFAMCCVLMQTFGIFVWACICAWLVYTVVRGLLPDGAVW